MTQMTRIYTEYWYNFKKISDNPRHLCHPCSNSGYVELTLIISRIIQTYNKYPGFEAVSHYEFIIF